MCKTYISLWFPLHSSHAPHLVYLTLICPAFCKKGGLINVLQICCVSLRTVFEPAATKSQRSMGSAISTDEPLASRWRKTHVTRSLSGISLLNTAKMEVFVEISCISPTFLKRFSVVGSCSRIPTEAWTRSCRSARPRARGSLRARDRCPARSGVRR